jgi:uncharacterized repeat protein (TIGR03803 family)
VNGGAYGYGTIFRMPVGGGPTTTIYNFTGGSDGGSPGSLIQASDGYLYGTASSGGASGKGVLFQMSLDGNFTMPPLHSFSYGVDGAYPDFLMQASDGNLYGTVYEGPANNGGAGTIFQMTLPTSTGGGNLTLLYAFTGGADGGYPTCGLVEASDGNLYGMNYYNGLTGGGSPNGYGVLFKMPKGGAPTTPTVLYRFTGGSDGGNPIGPLVVGKKPDGTPDGNLYGTTAGNHTSGNGTVFQFSLNSGTLTTLYGFTGGGDGAHPTGLIEANDANLYGTTPSGGANGYGTVFGIGRGANSITTLYTFTGGADGANPNSPQYSVDSSVLVQAGDGRLYGTTSVGGVTPAPQGSGTVFSLPTPIPVPVLTAISPNTATAGSSAFTLTAAGSKFVNGSTVNWNGTPLATTFVSDTQLTASVPATLLATPGAATVTVANPAGTSSVGLPFTITTPAPYILDISPDSALVNSASVPLTVNGQYFQSGATIYFSFEFGAPVALMPTTFVSSTELTATIPSALLSMPGLALVFVTNPDGTTSDPAVFFIDNPLPVLSSLSPTSTPAGSAAFTLTLQGSGFVAGDQVLWNGVSLPANLSGSSGTKLTAQVPAGLVANMGTVQVSVVDESGDQSNTLPFAITKPTVTLKSLSPSSLPSGSKTSTLTVAGTGFVSGAMVNWSNTQLTTKFVSSTKLTATIPAADLATKGKAQITVTNPNGATTNALLFTIK